MVQGDADSVIACLEKDLVRPNAEPLSRARSLELLSEQYHRLSDIGEARRYWDEALSLRQQTFGDSSAEAAVGYAYQARYHNYMAAPQADHQHLAFVEGARAKHLLKTRQGQIDPLERVLILREYGYAYKVSEMDRGMDNHHRLATTRSFFREALGAAIAVQDTIWIAQVTHDIGNTFNDEVGCCGGGLPIQTHRALVDSANHRYQRSISLMTAAGFGTSEAVMMDHFTTALLYGSAYVGDSCGRAITAYDEALRVMLRQAGNSAQADPLTYEARISNPAQMVELLYLRAVAFKNWDDKHPAPIHIDDAIRTMEAAVPYWEQLLRDYRSRDIEKVTGSYSHFPFRLGSELFLRRYIREGHPEDLHNSLLWSERNRDASLQRKRLLAELPPTKGRDTLLPGTTTLVAPKGSVVIAFNQTSFHGAFVVDENGLSVTELEEIPAALDQSTGRFNEFAVGQEGWTPERYAQESYAWYAKLLKPVLEHRQVREVVVVPYGSLALLPFEALCTSPVAHQWSEVAFLGKHYTVRYARSVMEALVPSIDCARAGAFLATADVDSLAELPFGKALTDRLHADLPGSALDHDLTGNELAGALASSGLIHLATHGVNPATPDAAPFLLLSDGAWSTDALFNASSQRTLAVLSTCSSGSGRNYQGEGVMSIAHAFLSAGTKCVVHTLWPVDDRATSEILSGFYEGLDQDLLASEALQRAKVDFIARHADDGLADPFYWSGIVITGTDVRLEPAQGSAGWYAIGAVLILAWSGYMYSKRARRSRALAET